MERIKKEIDKIGNAYKGFFDEQLEELRQSLKNYEVFIKKNFLNGGDLTTFDSPTSEILLSSSVQIQEGKVFWNPLEGVNLDYFNYLSSQLNVNNLAYIMPHLKASIKNFPAEFFLDKMILIDRIVRVLENLTIEKYPEILRLLSQLVTSMKLRWIESKKYLKVENEFEMSMKSEISSIMAIVSQCIDHYSHEKLNIIEHFELLKELFYLSLNLADYTLKTGNFDSKHLSEFLESFARLTKLSRHKAVKDKKNSILHRITYINCLLVINSFEGMLTKEITDKQKCLIFELDAAVLNASLQISHSKLYNLILINRKYIIDEDVNLRVFLIFRDYFNPVVKILQNHLELNAEEIIREGEIALHTIRIHQSQELVDLLLKSINKFCKSSAINAKILESAETIYLRLLCIEILEIKLQTYQNLREQICKFAQSYGAGYTGNLISVIGIPLIPEIIAEVLCFGMFDKNDQIRENSFLFLSTLFRMQVICPQALPSAVKIIRPILPLTPCLFGIKNNNIGIFAYDVLQENSSFEPNDLISGIARFLYSDNLRIQGEAKKNLLRRIGYDLDMVEIVPANFCIVKECFVRSINLPSGSTFDEEGYLAISTLLKTMDRSTDQLQMLLTQMNILMDSVKFCQRSHDDNLWVYFVGELGRYHLHNKQVRQLTISILMKWSLLHLEFRLYLSGEMNVLKFLIDTLIKFQDDDQIKTKASTFLFLLLFSEFIVTNEKCVSMPKILKNVQCPFKYETHWDLSPHNLRSVLEENVETIPEEDDSEVLEMFMRFLRINFNCLWNRWDVGGTINLEHEDALPIPEKLLLTIEDSDELLQMKQTGIINFFIEHLDNVTTFDDKMQILQQLEGSLIMFAGDKIKSTIGIEKRLARCWHYRVNSEENSQILRQSLKIFRIIMKSLKNEQIVDFAQHEFFTNILTLSNEQYDEETFTEVMKTFEKFVKLCVESEKILKLMPKNYFDNFFLSVNNQIFKNVMKNDEWSDVKKIAQVKPLLRLFCECLNLISIPADAIFHSFEKFTEVIPKIFKNHVNHVKESTRIFIHSDILRLIFDILLKLATLIGTQDTNFTKWDSDIFKRLQFWSNGESRTLKHYPWLIFAALTYKKNNFDSFNKNFNEAVKIPFIQSSIDTLLTTAVVYPLLEQDQNAIVAVLRNIITNSAESLNSNLTAKIIDRLIALKNFTALCTMIKTLILNNIECVVQIAKSRNLIKYLMDFQSISIDQVDEAKLNDLANRFETLTICYKYKPLKEHVADVLTHQVPSRYILLLNDCNKPRNAVHTKFDIMTIDLIIILIQSDSGIMRLSNMFKVPNVIDQFLMLSHEMMIESQKPNHIKLMLEFWCNVFDASVNFSSTAIDSVGSHFLDLPKYKKITKKPHGEFIECNLKRASLAIDLLFLQVVSTFNATYSKTSKESKMMKFS